MGYLPLPTLCTMNPAFDSGSVDLLCPLAQPSVPRRNVFFLSFSRILLRATASNYKAWSRGRLTWLGRAWWWVRFSKWGLRAGLRMGMLFKSNRCWMCGCGGARVEYVCMFTRDKNIKKISYCTSYCINIFVGYFWKIDSKDINNHDLRYWNRIVHQNSSCLCKIVILLFLTFFTIIIANNINIFFC